MKSLIDFSMGVQARLRNDLPRTIATMPLQERPFLPFNLFQAPNQKGFGALLVIGSTVPRLFSCQI